MSSLGSSYGNTFRFTIFGESHGSAIGAVLEGIPAGSTIDPEKLQAFLDLRSPGRGQFSSARKETDIPEFLSGILNGKAAAETVPPGQEEKERQLVTCGTPLTVLFRNSDARSLDYNSIENTPRPGHADYPAFVKFGGFQNAAGGGHFSGRLTAPLCAAGGICLQLLEKEGIRVDGHILSIGGKTDPAEIEAALDAARQERDSLGGIIECVVTGLPVGLGTHMFGGMENRIASAVFGIPAIKGIEFGDGFALACTRGSESNDAYIPAPENTGKGEIVSGAEDGAAAGRKLLTKTNHCGGILGGMADGMPLVFRVAVKPTPSIAKEQDTVDLKTMEPVKLSVSGRHDVCIALRAVPCVVSAAAVAVYDAMRSEGRC